MPGSSHSSFARLLAVLILAGCAHSPTGQAELARTVSLAERRWTAAGIRDYEYWSSHSCECLPDFARAARAARVTVRRGAVVAVADAATGEARPLTYRHPVDTLFAQLRYEVAAAPGLVSVAFDPALGYPRVASAGARDVDGGFAYRIDSLKVIP